MKIGEKIRKNRVDFLAGVQNYIPHPKELGKFTEYFPGRMKGDITCITGGTSSAKTSLCKFLVFKAIEWAIENKKNYKVKWFGLEESTEQFEYSLLSHLIYKESKGRVRYNIENFEGIGKSVLDEHIEKIESMQEVFDQYMSYIEFDELTANSYGIYKETRDLAISRGKFSYKGNLLNKEQIIAGERWDKYSPDDPNELIEVVIDHLSELHVQENEKSLNDAMTNLMKNLRLRVAKGFNYSVIPIQQQMLEMENLDHVKENFVYASLQGLGDNKTVSRAYLNVIGITNINRYGLRIANTVNGSYDISQLQDFQRVIGILKRRYGTVNRKIGCYFDGCCGYFEQLPPIATPEMSKVVEKIKSYQ